MLLMFSVGFVKMSRSVKGPGGFYSFVTAGLGKPAGLGGAFLALFGYMFIGFFAPSFFGVTLNGFVMNSLNGPDVPWYWYALGIIAVTTLLAYNRIDLSAKVLTVVMLLEVAVVVVFDIASFSANGMEAVQGAVFALPSLGGDATLGLALLFAVGNFFGFEATVIYRDEVKNPDRTIPRATYIAVVGIGLFYALAAWAFIAFLGPDNVQAAAESNTVNLFNDALQLWLGRSLRILLWCCSLRRYSRVCCRSRTSRRGTALHWREITRCQRFLGGCIPSTSHRSFQHWPSELSGGVPLRSSSQFWA